jgi:gliding motility-associated-like protein
VGVGELKYFRIFNRWGQLLFETKNTKDLWDGTFKGVRQPFGTYIWIAE